MSGLLESDFRSPVWSRMAETAAARLSELRELNDNSADEIRTALIRGQIMAFKEILSLPEGSVRDESHPALRGDDE